MTQEQMDAAMLRIEETISSGASPEEAANTAMSIVEDWQWQWEIDSFQFNIRGVLAEMEKALPHFRNLERMGSVVSVTVEDDPKTFDIPVPMDGITDTVRGLLSALRAAADALDGVRVKRPPHGLRVLDGGRP